MIYHWKNGENNKKNFTKKNVSYKSGKIIKEWRSKEIAKVTESKREREAEVIGQISYLFPRRRFKKKKF